MDQLNELIIAQIEAGKCITSTNLGKNQMYFFLITHSIVWKFLSKSVCSFKTHVHKRFLLFQMDKFHTIKKQAWITFNPLRFLKQYFLKEFLFGEGGGGLAFSFLGIGLGGGGKTWASPWWGEFSVLSNNGLRIAVEHSRDDFFATSKTIWVLSKNSLRIDVGFQLELSVVQNLYKPNIHFRAP